MCEIETLHGAIQSSLAHSSADHGAKAFILLAEALAELRTGIDRGDIQDARGTWENVLDVVVSEAKAFVPLS